MEELGKVHVSDTLDETSSVLLAFSNNDHDDDDPKDAPLVPVCAAVAFL